jgi:hypothetical protein
MSRHNSIIIPGNPGVHPRFREEGANRNPASGKGTGNLLEAEKVACPQLAFAGMTAKRRLKFY